jgi:hypothetical protein
MTDTHLVNYLLKDITISHNNKVLRSGKLLLFSIKDFYLHFTLSTDKQTKHFEIPYPFDIKILSNNLLLLDYALSSFKTEYEDLDFRIKNIGTKKKSRYFNSIIRLSCS